PEVTVTPKKLETSISMTRNKFDGLVEQARVWHHPESVFEKRQSKNVKLLIVDEADRLKFQSLELLRDLHDRGSIGIILMGMPGIERRIKRFGQLYSRIHLTYEFQPLTADETNLFIAEKWLQLGLPRSADDAVSTAIKRVGNGNFRVLNRIFTEIERLQKLNCLPLITPDLVETATRGLLLGAA
ncbi:AAA family ATPase, partial [Klebsiella aerogenes]|uniref:AAA family ATPase n=1 Tax=Klebsiella aerogenes TaxID=548 RepID=UPI001C37A0CF